MFGLLIYNGIERRSRDRAGVRENALDLTDLVASQQQTAIQNVEGLLGTLAGLTGGSNLSQLAETDAARCNAIFKQTLDQFASLNNIGVAGPDGEVICVAVPDDRVTVGDASFFQDAVATGAFTVGEYRPPADGAPAGLDFAIPVMDADGGLGGVYFASLDLDVLGARLAATNLPQGAAVTVMDNNGTVLARHSVSEGSDEGEDSPDLVGSAQIATALGDAILANERGITEAEGLDGARRLYSYTPVGDRDQPQAYVSIGLSTAAAYAAANSALARNLGLLAVATLLALTITWFGADRTIVRPLRAISGAAKRLAGGDFEARSGTAPGEGELAEFARSFDDMAAALEKNAAEREAAAVVLARHAEDLSRSNAELEQFAYVASHDLQEPLRMVGSYTQLLAKRYEGALDADAHEFIAYAVDGANRMQRLINDLLAYSRVGTGGEELAPTDLDGVVADAMQNLQAAIAESEAQVICDSLPVVRGDGGQLTQLFQNLIANAIKFCKDRAPDVRITAEQHGEHDCLIRVADNGIGIESEYADRIFVIFQRLHVQSEYPGTGVGLAICKKIVERHGGRIWLESRDGQGSTFCFTLPAVALAQAA